ncbi:MAG: hypothetical protein IPL63_06360 [Saprospiraceae bacterium]|nr:hypothetical protein [Saprospiraceae bacterium]
MYPFIKSIHSYFAWAALALIIIAIISTILTKNKESVSYKKWAFFGLMAVHIQLLIGLTLYFLSPFGFDNLSGDSMKDSFTRLLAVEHPFTNIVAIILISIGYSQSKKADYGSKKVLIFYTIGLILLLSRVPWSTWLS